MTMQFPARRSTGHRSRKLLTALSILLSVTGATNAGAATYRLNEDIVGFARQITTRYEDTLAAIAEREGLGFQELRDANPDVDAWLPGDGTTVVLPTRYVLPAIPRDGVVINLAEFRLYFFKDGRVTTYPVGIGRDEYQTPLGTSRVVAHIEKPMWTPTAVSRREHAEAGDPLPVTVPHGPDNPLGDFALKLSRAGYFIHGTNKPFGVGQTVSQGCIRLYNPHIATLSELVANGTTVNMIDQPLKIGRREEAVFIEVHNSPYSNPSVETLLAQIDRWSEGADVVLDRARIVDVLGARTGMPVRVDVHH
ncbi:MAG: L,D-transpeptidase family protein [Pseudomonadales bacterium]|nr:L,D-transpeptidase family protein [Pseudomonadales bacterium]MCP5183261.1 L,D-transpeptidase family protein [Pseudomonadales bacterium]